MKKTPFYFLFCISFFIIFFFTQNVEGSTIAKKTDIQLAVNGSVMTAERDLLVIDGRLLAPVGKVFENFNAKINWYEDMNIVQIIKGKDIISMEIDSNTSYINAKHTLSDVTPILVRGTVMVPVNFVADNLGITVNWDADNRIAYLGDKSNEVKNEISRGNGNRYKVVIDAGHGGKDTGAAANGLVEKNLNLDIALKLEKLLKSRGITTYMTRTNDSYPDLYTRAEMANKKNADLFISIHHNAGHSKYSGSMALYFPASGNFTGRDFASTVEKELTSVLRTKSLGVIPRPNLVVLRKTKMPAVIAEIGYITNKQESKRLTDEDFRKNAAKALETAVIKALRRLG